MTVETRSPSNYTVIMPGWENPENAYASDDARTVSSVNGAETKYTGYGFNVPSNATINKVEGGIEGYRTYPSTTCIPVWIGSGSEMEYLDSLDVLESEVTEWYTSKLINWTPSKVNAIWSKIRSDEGGGGCFAEDSLILMWDRTTKKVQDIKPDDVLLGMDDATRQWIPSVVREMFVRKGDFQMAVIHYRKPNGKIVTSRVTQDHAMWSPSVNRRVKPLSMESFITNPINGSPTSLTLHDFYKERLVEVPVVKLEEYRADTVYDIRLKSGHHLFFGDDLLGMAKDCLMCTAYVDWLPIRVTYTIPSGKQIRVTGDGIAEFIG